MGMRKATAVPLALLARRGQMRAFREVLNWSWLLSAHCRSPVHAGGVTCHLLVDNFVSRACLGATKPLMARHTRQRVTSDRCLSSVRWRERRRAASAIATQ